MPPEFRRVFPPFCWFPLFLFCPTRVPTVRLVDTATPIAWFCSIIIPVSLFQSPPALTCTRTPLKEDFILPTPFPSHGLRRRLFPVPPLDTVETNMVPSSPPGLLPAFRPDWSLRPLKLHFSLPSHSASFLLMSPGDGIPLKDDAVRKAFPSPAHPRGLYGVPFSPTPSFPHRFPSTVSHNPF